ncbi:acetylserotonin O-methyltransferase [Amycolatopsis balhimycina]|nr:acetylserotonin O-methyltransferase [Amycolatopsis balhimycina]
MTTPMTRAVAADPVALKRLGNAFCEAKLLLTATELGLFTVLDAGPATAEEVRAALKLGERGVRDFLDALVALGLLERTDGRYRNGPAAGQFLVRDKESYAGGFLERANRMLYPAWGNLTEALRTGAPQAQAPYSAVAANPAKLTAFLSMMDSVNGLLVPDIDRAFPWAEVRTVADIGGARGNLAGLLARNHDTLRGTVFDLPALNEAANAHLAGLGVADRVTFQPGDFFADELPTADVLILGHVLHNWSPEQRKQLVELCYAALEPGGALLVYDAMLDDEPGSISKLLVSLNMLLVTEGGSEYPVGECLGYLADAGFRTTGSHPIGADNTLVIGYK